MSATPGAVLILVCPTCGKKFRGNPDKPDARYECPEDKSVLTKDAPKVAAPPAPAFDAPSFGAMGSDPAPPPPDSMDAPASSESGTVPTPEPTMFAGSNEAFGTGSSGAAAPEPPSGPETMFAGSNETIVDGSQTISNAPATQPFKAATTKLSRSTDAPKLTENGTFEGFDDRKSVVAVLEAKLHPESADAMTLLGGKYEVVMKLGQGGGGQVIKVLDRDLRREVAMKMLLPQQTEAPVPEDVLLRFVKEAQATGQLEHPNIVPVHDLAVDSDGHIYFTLKYAQGDSLKEVIRGRRDNLENAERRNYRDMFDARQMVEVLIGICQGVAYAHSKGIIHRDLKPENVMLGKFGEVMVMDWGLAKALGKTQLPIEQNDTVADLSASPMGDASMTMEGSVAGTPAYMSPEQASGKISELNERTDIYSLGAILYEILTGQPPYTGGSAIEVVKKVLAGPAEEISSGTHGFKPVPRELKAICEKAMMRLPGKRFASVAEMRDELQNYLSSRPVRCCPDTLPQRVAKFVKRNRHLVATSIASVVTVLFLVLVVSWTVGNYRAHKHISQAKYFLERARDPGKGYAPVKVAANDPYREQMEAMARGDMSRAKRALIQNAIGELLLVLDSDPRNRTARGLMASAYMEQWRLALQENNTELMRATRSEVERYAGMESEYSEELNGLGSVDVLIDPAEADAYLYKFEPLHATDKQGNALPTRLVPVPFDTQLKAVDSKFLIEEAERARSGKNSFDDTHSIFRLEMHTASKANSGGKVNLSGIPPGSYLLLIFAPGRATTRYPFKLERLGTLKDSIVLPRQSEMPPGFFYIPGGEAWVGGESANAVPRHKIHVRPFFMYHDEISMGDYGEFLKAIGGAAKSRIPRDFGRALATLGGSAGLLPADGSDPEHFLALPVRGISYSDVVAYIEWRTQRDHLAYRLPDEWEWESTCRGADGRRYSWGDQPGQGLAVVMQGYGDTGAKMSWRWQDYKDESPAGVHNLAGGVAEWTASQYDPKATATDPVYGQHTIRGNAWSLPPNGLECSFRTSGQPDYYHPTIGFRLALDYPLQSVGGLSVQGALQDMKDRAAAAAAAAAPTADNTAHSH